MHDATIEESTLSLFSFAAFNLLTTSPCSLIKDSNFSLFDIVVYLTHTLNFDNFTNKTLTRCTIRRILTTATRVLRKRNWNYYVILINYCVLFFRRGGKAAPNAST